MSADDKPYGLAQARDDLDMTQGEIAKLLGTDQGTISKIESGKLLGPYFLSYLKFLAEQQIDLNRVLEHYQYKI